jgi:trimeric autotransporter adhesin
VLEIQATGDTNPNNNRVTETVTLATGNLEVLKEQAIDANCDGTEPESAFTKASLTADPGQCILYRVIATNVGSRDALNVRIDDEVPSYTKLRFAPNATGGSAPQVDPAFNGSNGTLIRSTHGTLTPSGQARLTFGVQIDD